MPINYREWVTFSFLKHAEGGPGLTWVRFALEDAGIPFRTGHSPYIGHSAVQVPKRFQKRAARIIWEYTR